MKFKGDYEFINTNKLAEDLSSHIKSGRISFSIPVQRGDVWDRARKSAFILNVIQRGPTFPIFVNRKDGVDYVIDGQQRLRTTSSFIENQFSLSRLAPLKTVEGEPIDFTGMKFNDLPSDIKEIILSYNFSYCYAIDLTSEQVTTVFVRLNSGKPLSTTEMTKAQIISINEVGALAKHSVFERIISKTGIQKSQHIGLIMQFYVAIFESNKNMLFSSIQKVLSEKQITKEQQTHLIECFDFLENVYIQIRSEKSDISKKLSTVFKRKLHLVSVIYTISQALQLGKCDIGIFVPWVKHFFNTFNTAVDKTTISESYNNTIGSATNKEYSVNTRLSCMFDDYCHFLKSQE